MHRQRNYLVKYYRTCYHIEKERESKMKCLLKNGKFLAVILAITVLFSQASLVPAYAQEANNEQEGFAQQKFNQVENLEENEWEPYSELDRADEIFILDPSGSVKTNFEYLDDNTIESIQTQRGIFPSIIDLCNAIFGKGEYRHGGGNYYYSCSSGAFISYHPSKGVALYYSYYGASPVYYSIG